MKNVRYTIAVNPEVERIHQEGVGLASRDGDFGGAFEKFEEADRCSLNTYVSGETEVDDLTDGTTSSILHRYRIDRDRQFTWGRVGIRDKDPGMVQRAYYRLADHDHSNIVADSVGPDYFTPESWRYIQAERGATAGVFGRLATVALVMGGEAEGISAERARTHYGEAHRFARGNRYYSTSNAMNAARHERLFGGKKDVIRWVCVASGQLVRSLVSDRANTKAAARTLISRIGMLRSTETARTSVLERP